MSFVDVYRENDNNDENSSHNFSHNDFNYENLKNFKANNHRQVERQKLLNIVSINQIFIIDNILNDKRSFDFANKKRNHIKFHD